MWGGLGWKRTHSNVKKKKGFSLIGSSVHFQQGTQCHLSREWSCLLSSFAYLKLSANFKALAVGLQGCGTEATLLHLPLSDLNRRLLPATTPLAINCITVSVWHSFTRPTVHSDQVNKGCISLWVQLRWSLHMLFAGLLCSDTNSFWVSPHQHKSRGLVWRRVGYMLMS